MIFLVQETENVAEIFNSINIYKLYFHKKYSANNFEKKTEKIRSFIIIIITLQIKYLIF